MTNPTFAVVIVNYASSSMLEECIGGRTWANDPTVVIVDNFSSEPERASIRLLCESRDWHLVERPNIGFGSGMNAGVGRARELGCDAIVLLNPDTVASSEALANLASLARTQPNTLHAPLIYRENGAVWFSGATLDPRSGITSTRPGSNSADAYGWLTGACLALSLTLWDKIGGFDDEYFLYWEDVDLSYRCREAGGSLVLHEEISIVHSVGATQSGSGKSAIYVYYNCRNRLLFARRHLPRSIRRRWMLVAPRYAYRVLGRSGHRYFLTHFASLTSAAIRGTLRGALG